TCPSPVLGIDHTAGTHLYRIAQEAVTNSVRHGQARHIWIRLITSESGLNLTVKDDGSGLAKGWLQRPGMGLRIMKYRASTIGATCVIKPGPACGTVVTCTVPLPASPTPVPANS